ncbi:alpha/beta hydrolase [Pannonibacter phragmitetus]|uniref:alpha/beta fold hydrolase n=1 Tax=Pannonibacter phragmitetus TaxID=121719 RepID=UPI00067D08DA|nr:alpha/beta hydrolase [Pannonibacter phragmitetus]KND19706.1 alpha/beta hydrolase [Pannonibacter phragmitetus]
MTLTEIPGNPIPDGAVAGFIETPDRVRLRFARFPAKPGQLKGTVTLLQGRAEFIEKYFEVITELQERGFHVVAFDWRGQGGSDSHPGSLKRGNVSSFSRYRIDLETVVRQISLADCPGPHYVLAHSTGGAVFLSATERLRTQISRAVLSAPFTGLSDFGRKERMIFRLVRLLAMLGLALAPVPGRGNGKAETFETNRQTSDRRRFERMVEIGKANPALEIGPPTIGWLAAAVRCLMSFRELRFGPSVAVPVLMITAGRDRIVSSRATEELSTRIRAAGFIEIPGAEHELLMEQDVYRDQFWAAFDAFIPGEE